MPRSKELSQQMRAQSRKRILDAARRLFATQGYFNCKVSDIAREAEMSQGNIYWYFSSKEELLKAVLTDGFEALGAVLQKAQSHPGTGVEKLVYLVEQYLAFARERGAFSRILMALLAHGGVPFLRNLGFDMEQIGMGYHQHLSPILTEVQAEGHLIDVDPNILAMFFFGFFNGLMVTYGQDWLELPTEAVQEAALRLLGSDAE